MKFISTIKTKIQLYLSQILPVGENIFNAQIKSTIQITFTMHFVQVWFSFRKQYKIRRIIREKS